MCTACGHTVSHVIEVMTYLRLFIEILVSPFNRQRSLFVSLPRFLIIIMLKYLIWTNTFYSCTYILHVLGATIIIIIQWNRWEDTNWMEAYTLSLNTASTRIVYSPKKIQGSCSVYILMTFFCVPIGRQNEWSIVSLYDRRNASLLYKLLHNRIITWC